MDHATRLEQSLAPYRAPLLEHEIYASLHDATALQTFMTSHVFAVWDAMTLLKSLQRRLTCTEVPWFPPRDAFAARVIQEMVLREECDEVAPGFFQSHLELYLDAMEEVGADRLPFLTFLEMARPAYGAEYALEKVNVLDCTRRFVGATLRTAHEGSVHEVAAALLYGREELLPAMFGLMLARLERQPGMSCASFRRYLARHTDVDAHARATRGRRLLAQLCEDDPTRWAEATRAATTALVARKRLWDGVLRAMSAAGSAEADAAWRGRAVTIIPGRIPAGHEAME